MGPRLRPHRAQIIVSSVRDDTFHEKTKKHGDVYIVLAFSEGGVNCLADDIASQPQYPESMPKGSIIRERFKDVGGVPNTL